MAWGKRILQKKEAWKIIYRIGHKLGMFNVVKEE